MAVATWTFTLNGSPVSITADGTTRLLWVVRDMLGLDRKSTRLNSSH